MSKALLYDSTECIGCRACEGACAQHWELPYEGEITAQETLSEHKLTAVVTSGEHFGRLLCMHCQDPSCVSVCPVGAFQKTQLGPVVYNEDRCIGCRYCMLACPFHVPVYEWSIALPRVRKCDLCEERLKEGKPTACSEACPTQATITGERDELIAEAQRRIAENPDRYYPQIYGLEEAGGSSVLMLLATPPSKLGLAGNVPRHALPALTWRALSQVPTVVSVGSALLGGVYWISHRRDEVAANEGRNAPARHQTPEREETS